MGLFACSTDKNSKVTFENLRLRNSIKDSLSQVLWDSVLYSIRAGDRGLESSEYRRVNWIIKTSNKEELKELLKSDNAFVKAIGFKGLFLTKDKEWFSRLIPMLRDTGEYVAFQDGCFRYDYRLPEYCLLEVLRYEHMDGILTKEQTDIIDRLIKKYKIKVLPKQTATNNVFASSGVDA